MQSIIHTFNYAFIYEINNILAWLIVFFSKLLKNIKKKNIFLEFEVYINT